MAEQDESEAGGTDVRTESTEPTTFLTRRRLMKGTAGAVGAGALAGLGLWYGTQPSLAASTTQESDGSVTISTNAGQVNDVSVAPTFDLDWDDFGGGVGSFGFDIEAAVDGSTASVYSTSGVTDGSDSVINTLSFNDGSSVDNYSGSVTITCVNQSIIDGSTITIDSFPTNVPEGESRSTSVELSLTATGVTGLNGSEVTTSSPSTQSFDVIVENPDGTLTATISSTNSSATGADSADEVTTTTTTTSG